MRCVGTSYNTAWSILVARYDQRRLLSRDHMTAIKHLRPLKEESSAGLQQLLDELKRHRDQLKALKKPVENWDDWFLLFASDAMDPATRRAWEEELEGSEDSGNSGEGEPTFATLESFLQQRCRMLQSVEIRPSSKTTTLPRRSEGGRSGRGEVKAFTTNISDRSNCAACQGPHTVSRCTTFKGLSLKERRDLVARTRGCYNCLRQGHTVRNCPSSFTCRVCSSQHHTLLHEESRKRPGASIESGVPAKTPKSNDQSSRSGQRTEHAS